MRKLTLIFLLSLTIFCNGCAFAIPWWMFLVENDPSPAGASKEQHLVEKQNPLIPLPSGDKSEIANAGTAEVQR